MSSNLKVNCFGLATGCRMLYFTSWCAASQINTLGSSVSTARPLLRGCNHASKPRMSSGNVKTFVIPSCRVRLSGYCEIYGHCGTCSNPLGERVNLINPEKKDGSNLGMLLITVNQRLQNMHISQPAFCLCLTCSFSGTSLNISEPMALTKLCLCSLKLN